MSKINQKMVTFRIDDRAVLTVSRIIELGYIRNARDRRTLSDELSILKRKGDPDGFIPKIEKLLSDEEKRDEKN